MFVPVKVAPLNFRRRAESITQILPASGTLEASAVLEAPLQPKSKGRPLPTIPSLTQSPSQSAQQGIAEDMASALPPYIMPTSHTPANVIESPSSSSSRYTNFAPPLTLRIQTNPLTSLHATSLPNITSRSRECILVGQLEDMNDQAPNEEVIFDFLQPSYNPHARAAQSSDRIRAQTLPAAPVAGSSTGLLTLVKAVIRAKKIPTKGLKETLTHGSKMSITTFKISSSEAVNEEHEDIEVLSTSDGSSFGVHPSGEKISVASLEQQPPAEKNNMDEALDAKTLIEVNNQNLLAEICSALQADIDARSMHGFVDRPTGAAPAVQIFHGHWDGPVYEILTTVDRFGNFGGQDTVYDSGLIRMQQSLLDSVQRIKIKHFKQALDGFIIGGRLYVVTSARKLAQMAENIVNSGGLSFARKGNGEPKFEIDAEDTI